LNWSSEDPNIFCLLYYGILFLSILVKIDIGTKSIIYILEKHNIVQSFGNVSTTSRKWGILFY